MGIFKKRHELTTSTENIEDNEDGASVASKEKTDVPLTDARLHLLYTKKLHILYVVILCTFLGLVVPIFISSYYTHREKPPLEGACLLEPEFRVECLSGVANLTDTDCYAVHCCWDSTDPSLPKCYAALPSRHYYTVTEVTKSDETSMWPSFRLSAKPNLPYTVYGRRAEKANVNIRSLSHSHVNVQIYNPDTMHIDESFPYGVSSEYVVTVPKVGDALSVQVQRNSTKESLFDTAYGTLVISDDYLEITLRMPTDRGFGMGKGASMFGFDGTRYTYLNGMVPGQYRTGFLMYLGVDEYDEAFGLWLNTTYPTEVQLHPMPALVIKVLGGHFDFHVFGGPTPRDVYEQMSNLTGRTKLPPYWALGYHMCLSPGNETVYLNGTNMLMNNNISYDSDCIDRDLLKQFRVNTVAYPGFENIMTNLSHANVKFLPVGYSQYRVNTSDIAAIEMMDIEYDQLFMTNGTMVGNNTFPYIGMYHNRTVVYPDTFHPDLHRWLSDGYHDLFSNFKDGIVLSDDAPESERTNCTVDLTHMSYIPRHADIRPPACVGIKHWNNKTHLDVHNEYGHRLMAATDQVMSKYTDARRMVMTDSGTTSSGHIGGATPGVYNFTWSSMGASMYSAIEASMGGVAMTGTPICGNRDSNPRPYNAERLCIRWHQIGLMMPWARNEQGINGTSRSPVSFSKYASNRLAVAIRNRYQLLPYIYTQMYVSATVGHPVLRPVMFEFWKDPQTHNATGQFMLGPAMLVIPDMDDTQKPYAYTPWSVWYEYDTGNPIPSSQIGTWKGIQTMEYQIHVYLRGGHIVPVQDMPPDDIVATTAEESMKGNYTLKVALNCAKYTEYNYDYYDNYDFYNETVDQTEVVCAEGILYLDNGTSTDSLTRPGGHDLLQFQATQYGMTIKRTQPSYECYPYQCITQVEVLGFGHKPNHVNLDNEPLDPIYINYLEASMVLKLNITLDLCKGSPTRFDWW